MSGIKRPVALIDMDGTLCDYHGAMKRDMLKILSRHESLNEEFHKDKRTYITNRMDMIKNQPNWWLNLEKLESGFEILEMLHSLDFENHILTKGPTKTTAAWSQKIEWCKENIPEHIDHSVLMTEHQEGKGLVYGKVLVDDYPPYVLSWLKYRPRGLVILPNQRWNANFTHPNVIRFNDKNKVKIKEALQAARHR